jgi:hypothetical protein
VTITTETRWDRSSLFRPEIVPESEVVVFGGIDRLEIVPESAVVVFGGIDRPEIVPESALMVFRVTDRPNFLLRQQPGNFESKPAGSWSSERISAKLNEERMFLSISVVESPRL